MAATTALRKALTQGISSGTFTDTKIILYSRKDPSGRVFQPKALYANSQVLKTIPHFNDLLSRDFDESWSKAFKEAINEEATAEDYGYLSDSDLEAEIEDDGDPGTVSSKHKRKRKVTKLDPMPVAPGVGKIVREEHEKGKIVKIPDIAFVTFQAFLMYLYTGAIAFAPFGSEENRRSRRVGIGKLPDDNVSPPSPKSIYRLADKYDVPALKNLALNQIRGELAKCDIVEESFSRFASQHDEIRNLFVERLAFMWLEDPTTETTRTSVEKKVCSFVKGELDHAMETLSTLWEIVSKDKDMTAPTSGDTKLTVGSFSPFRAARLASPARWTSVRRALVESIRNGVFFDGEYWVRYTKAANSLKPIYFSNMIMNDKTHQLNELVRHLDGINYSTSDLERDSHVESDCGGDFPGTENVLSKTEERDQTRAVLIRGSFSAWRSLFFYRCTDEISFAPLESQGAHRRSSYIRKNTLKGMPPPCSPKSVYVLANLLGMQPLRDRALADIKSKVSSENVVSEVFSQVTADQKGILEEQCALLISTYKNPETIALVKENIRKIPGGSLSHCADALNLVFKKAFELKKSKRGAKREDLVFHPFPHDRKGGGFVFRF